LELLVVIGIVWFVIWLSGGGSSSNSNYTAPPKKSVPKPSQQTRAATTSSTPRSTTRAANLKPTPRNTSTATRAATGTPAKQYAAKDEYPKYLNLIRKHGIQRLYHFTDRSNIASIRRLGGLVSWQEANRRRIAIPRPGGDELSRNLDQRRNLGNYVRLSFHPDQPMKYVAQTSGRVPNPVILQIKTDVIVWKDTLFSDVNAAAGYANVGGTLVDLNRINFSLFQRGQWTDEAEKHQFQAEVLVYRFIPSRFILNLDRY